jgi:hypothetical protein
MEFEFCIHYLINFLYIYLLIILSTLSTGFLFQQILYALELDSPVKDFMRSLIKHFINIVFERLFGGSYVLSSGVN